MHHGSPIFKWNAKPCEIPFHYKASSLSTAALDMCVSVMSAEFIWSQSALYHGNTDAFIEYGCHLNNSATGCRLTLSFGSCFRLLGASLAYPASVKSVKSFIKNLFHPFHLPGTELVEGGVWRTPRTWWGKLIWKPVASFTGFWEMWAHSETWFSPLLKWKP